jgi:hypothetical protein
MKPNKLILKWLGQKEINRSGSMPTYDFKNLETGEIEIDRIMTIAQMEEYVKDPNITQLISTSKNSIISNTDGAVLKTAGDGWKEVQDRIRSGLPPADRGLINTK